MKITEKWKGIYYIPVLGGLTIQNFLHGCPKWWDKDGYLNYSHYLLAYIYLKQLPQWQINQIQFSKEGIFMVDSSGFQVVSQGINVNPKDVIVLQQDNGNCGLILDYPPYKKVRGSSQFGGRAIDIFDYSLKRTVNNTKIMVGNMKRDSDFVLYGVIQGETHKQRQQWFEEVSNIYNFEAWALSPKPSNSYQQIVSYLIFAKNKGIKNIHILQVSGIWGMMIIIYLARVLKCFDLITFDSASAALAGTKKRMIVDPMKSTTIYIGQKNEKKIDLDVKIDCNCKVCQNFSLEYLRERDDTYPRPIELIIEHNISKMLERVEILSNMPLKEMEKMLQSRGILKTINSILKVGEKEFHEQIADHVRDRKQTIRTL